MVIAWLNVQSLRNKSDAVRQTITERSIDVMALSETWHGGSDDVCLRLNVPDGYAVLHAALRSPDNRQRPSHCADRVPAMFFDRRQWVDATRRRFQLYRTKTQQYWADRLARCGRSSPLIWRSMSSMFSRQQNVTATTSHTACLLYTSDAADE